MVFETDVHRMWRDILLIFRQHRNVLHSSRSGAAYNKRDGVNFCGKRGRELIHIYSIRFVTLGYELKKTKSHAESSIERLRAPSAKLGFALLAPASIRGCHIEKASHKTERAKKRQKTHGDKTHDSCGQIMKSSSRPGVKRVNMAIRGEPRAPTSKAKDLRARTSD